MGGDDVVKLWKPTDKTITKMLGKLGKQIKEQYNIDYTLKDFELTRVDFTVNIDVKRQKDVDVYVLVKEIA